MNNLDGLYISPIEEGYTLRIDGEKIIITYTDDDPEKGTIVYNNENDILAEFFDGKEKYDYIIGTVLNDKIIRKFKMSERNKKYSEFKNIPMINHCEKYKLFNDGIFEKETSVGNDSFYYGGKYRTENDNIILKTEISYNKGLFGKKKNINNLNIEETAYFDNTNCLCIIEFIKK